MLTITATLDRETLLPYCKESKIPYNPGLYLYIARDRDDILGAGLFQIEGDTVSFLHYFPADTDDHFVFDGVLRAGFNYATEQNIPTGEIPVLMRKQHQTCFEKLNYPNETSFTIDNFFSKYKNCAPGRTAQ